MDRNGDLLWNSNGIRAASGTVTHSCQVPGNPMQYYLFTVGADGKPYVHLIDLSVTAITQGAVLIKNILLDNAAGANYNRAMAVVDDRTAYGKSMLYMARRIGGQYTLMGLDIEALTQNGSGQLQALAPAIGGSSLGQHGLLQISPDGRELAMVSGSGSPMGMFMWATANIHRYNLSADHTQATFLSTYSEANAAFRYMDYSPGGQYLYFVKSGTTLGGATHQVKRQNLTTTAVNTVVNNFGGDIRRTKHGEMLVATPAFLYPDEAFRIQSPNTASPSIVWGSFTGNDAKAEGALGLQPLVYELLPAISTRSLNQKRYELTDHLGNVRAVVSDRKLCDNSALPTPPTAYRAEVLNQTDFYPFGMISRSTMASGEEYRFSFQGQEKDDEIHGSPGTSLNYEFRMHDSRIGRFMSIDPLSGKFPHNSPYAFSENRVLDAIELEGLEAAQLKQHGQALWDAFTLSVSEACQPVIQLIDEHLVLEGRVTLSAGLAVEGKVNAGPLAKLEIKANAYSVTLAEGKADMTDPRNPASYTGSHVGDGGTTKVTQGIGITLKDNLTKQFGVEFDASHQWQTSSNNLSGQSDHQNTSAVTVGMELWNAKKAGPVPMSPAGAQSKGALEGKGSADPDACPGCMDFGAKLQVILGLEINLKIGVK